MAWTYADYLEQTTDTDRLSRLRQHMTEVSEQIQANLRAGNNSKDNQVLVEYRGQLVEELARLERAVGSLDSTSPRASAGFLRGRPR